MRGNEGRGELLRYFWPVVVELLVVGIICSANQIVINAFSQDAVAATTSAGQFVTLVINMYGIISVGESILLAPFWGARKYEESGKIIITALFNNVVLGIVLGGLSAMAAPDIMKLMHVPAGLMEMGCAYLDIAVGLSVGQAILMTLTAAMRSMGRMKTVMWINLLINGGTLGLNYLIFKLVPIGEQTIYQYAINGIIAQCLGIAVFLWIFIKEKKLKFMISIHEFKTFWWRNTIKLLRIGTLAGLEGIIYLVAQTIVVSFIGRLGADELLAKGYVGNIAAYMVLATNAIVTAAAPLIGGYMGENRPDKAEKIFAQSIRFSLEMTALISVVCLGIGKFFFKLYTKDDAIIGLCMTILFINVLVELARAPAAQVVSGLKAIGDVKYPFKMVIAGSVLNIVISYLFGIVMHMGLPGIWLGYLGDLLLRSVCGLLHFKKCFQVR